MEDTKVEEAIVETPKEENYNEESFANEYNELCKKRGFRINVTPVWEMTNHNTFELKIRTNIERIN